jgi:hypothetical protein
MWDAVPENWLDMSMPIIILAQILMRGALQKQTRSSPTMNLRRLPRLPNGEFDTIVALAVIEHDSDPGAFLGELCLRLSDSQEPAIVITTPHPYFETFHRWGAAVGLFSRSACEEHSEMLDSAKLEEMGKRVGLQVTRYERFLMGANQLVIYKRRGVE